MRVYRVLWGFIGFLLRVPFFLKIGFNDLEGLGSGVYVFRSGLEAFVSEYGRGSGILLGLNPKPNFGNSCSREALPLN